jgi:hypothetical protein
MNSRGHLRKDLKMNNELRYQHLKERGFFMVGVFVGFLLGFLVYAI